jgi:hypothetical protein
VGEPADVALSVRLPSEPPPGTDSRKPTKMWPWEHLAFGYLFVSLTWRVGRHRVDGWIVLSVALGTQLPDLVDKPLAWYVHVLPGARSLAHSLFVAVPVCLVVLGVAYAVRRPRRHRVGNAFAFSIGYASHLLGDALPALLRGNYERLTFLFWPRFPLPSYDGVDAVFANLADIVASPTAYLATGSYRVAIVLAVVVLWVDDGSPGLAGVGRYLIRTARAND